MSNIDETAKTLILNTIQNVFTESAIEEPIVEETPAEKLRREVADKIAHDLQERKEATKMYKSGDATTSDEKETTIKEKSIKNTITINPTIEEEIAQLSEKQMVVTNADKKANTPAYQNFKKGMKGKDGQPLYKAADHLKDEFEHHQKDENGNTIPHEDEIAQENYRAMRNPEKYKPDDESDKPYSQRSKANRMKDPKRGINSPAFKEFMRKQGMESYDPKAALTESTWLMYEKKKLAEAKVDKGRSDYGKASIRNYRRMGPGHGDPGMFDPSGKRGKTIEKRREEHKARRGVKGAKVPAYKREEYIPEEGYDHIKDRIAMAGGDPSSQKKKDATKYPPQRSKSKGKTVYQKQAEKEHGKGVTAIDIVRKKYKGQIMGDKK